MRYVFTELVDSTSRRSINVQTTVLIETPSNNLSFQILFSKEERRKLSQKVCFLLILSYDLQKKNKTQPAEDVVLTFKQRLSNVIALYGRSNDTKKTSCVYCILLRVQFTFVTLWKLTKFTCFELKFVMFFLKYITDLLCILL